MNKKPQKGAIAICSRGMLGLITSDKPEKVEYQDGNTGLAWTGIQIGADTFGEKWSSRNPKVLNYIWEFYRDL